MKKRRLIFAVCLGFASAVMCVGVVYAATVTADSLWVGKQGVGGVTYFNGTIINETTGTGGVDNPVTFGDNVRIDGRVYRGATAGTGDSTPFSVNDNMEVAGSLTVGSLAGTGIVSSANIADGAVATADLADSTVTSGKITDGTVATADLASGAATQTAEDENTTVTTTKFGADYDTAAEVQITTGNSTLFCQFTGYGTTDTPDHKIAIALIVDGTILIPTYRSATMGDGEGHIILATSDLMAVTAGAHTIQVGWNTSHAGITATMFYNTLDCIELKK
ncbi:MAG: hypothetical protein V1668_01540 [Patescibacteria group bacterium]